MHATSDTMLLSSPTTRMCLFMLVSLLGLAPVYFASEVPSWNQRQPKYAAKHGEQQRPQGQALLPVPQHLNGDRGCIAAQQQRAIDRHEEQQGTKEQSASSCTLHGTLSLPAQRLDRIQLRCLGGRVIAKEYADGRRCGKSQRDGSWHQLGAHRAQGIEEVRSAHTGQDA
jgi:hypothetical protein